MFKPRIFTKQKSLIAFFNLMLLGFLTATSPIAVAVDNTFLYTGDLHNFVDNKITHPPIFISGGMLIDGTGAAPRANPGLLIRAGVFEEVGLEDAPSDALHVNAKGKWLLPGLFDMHAHITYYVPTGWHVEDDIMNAVRAERFLENYQAIGVTTVSDVGSRYNVGYSLKRAQRMGLIHGSRLFVSGPLLTTPGGHATEFIPYERPMYAVEASSPWEFRQRVREAVKMGTDQIKLTPPYTMEELSATVAEGHAWKIPVTTHIGGISDLSQTSARVAVDAGVDSVHHLYPYGEGYKQVIKDMVKKNIYVVPTIGYHLRELEGLAHIAGNFMEVNLGHTYNSMMALFKSMQKAKIKFVVGTELLEK